MTRLPRKKNPVGASVYDFYRPLRVRRPECDKVLDRVLRSSGDQFTRYTKVLASVTKPRQDLKNQDLIQCNIVQVKLLARAYV